MPPKSKEIKKLKYVFLDRTTPSISFQKVFLLFSFLSISLYSMQLLVSPTRRKANPCTDHFLKETFGDNDYGISFTLLVEVYKVSDESLADCIEYLSNPGDHLYIESENSKKSVNCALLNPFFERFNNKLECRGFNPFYTEEQRHHQDLYFRANYIYEQYDFWFSGTLSRLEIIEDLYKFGNDLIHSEPEDSETGLINKAYHLRNGNYFKSLANRILQLSVDDMKLFLTDENYQLGREFEYYEKNMNSTVVQEGLVKTLKPYISTRKGIHFFATGQREIVDPHLNPFLKTLLDETEINLQVYAPRFDSF